MIGKKRIAFFILPLTALMFLPARCSEDRYELAAKSIITAQETYNAVMNASAEAYKSDRITETGKAEVITYGAAAHDAIALAQSALSAALGGRTRESAPGVVGAADAPDPHDVLDASLPTMKNTLTELMHMAVSAGVAMPVAAESYRQELHMDATIWIEVAPLILKYGFSAVRKAVAAWYEDMTEDEIRAKIKVYQEALKKPEEYFL